MEFARGNTRVLVVKPVIGAWGLNLQHCAHMVSFPSHSYEQYYQSIRRCWRFGQKRPVHVDVISTEGEQRVLANLQRKAHQADEMFSCLTKSMNDVLRIEKKDLLINKMNIPSWL